MVSVLQLLVAFRTKQRGTCTIDRNIHYQTPRPPGLSSAGNLCLERFAFSCSSTFPILNCGFFINFMLFHSSTATILSTSDHFQVTFVNPSTHQKICLHGTHSTNDCSELNHHLQTLLEICSGGGGSHMDMVLGTSHDTWFSSAGIIFKAKLFSSWGLLLVFIFAPSLFGLQ